MSICSARYHQERIGEEDGSCIPLSLDAIMHRADLPEKYYDMFIDGYRQASAGSGLNGHISKLLQDYFHVRPRTSNAAPVAVFHTFGASPQDYFPDVPYSYPRETKEREDDRIKSDRQYRVAEVLIKAARTGCLVLADMPSTKGPHAGGLELIDPGTSHPTAIRYAVRNGANLADSRLLSPYHLSGVQLPPFQTTTDYVPLYEIHEPWYPEGETSPTLIVLPPEPN